MSVRRTPSEAGRVPTPKAVPPFDPELSVALAALGKESREPLTPGNLEARQERDAASRPRPTAEGLRADGRFDVAEFCVPGPPGGPDVTLVSARPAGLVGPLPLLYYMHGGAMVMGNAWSVLPRILREWALPLGLAVISVEYRLAPRAQYPGPLEDCYAGLVWAAGHAAELDIDVDRVVIGGKSAGGGLAAALALLARDRGGPGALGQLLLCPMLDDRGSTFSSHQMTGLGVWDLTSNTTAWKALLGDRYGAADLPPYAAPARATDLSGLPPTYIDVGSAEMFRDEDVAYANAIWQAGGEAELHVWPGAYHGFDGLAPRAALSQDARNARTRWLQRLLAQSGARVPRCSTPRMPRENPSAGSTGSGGPAT
ncbi:MULTISPECIES: alpha/beta hydrolase [unclassified Streptomyces]|uniref:alpha/beta hydrolase n=1 Tax=unclassified Streptomyces TaxID=2593676 RepID=UPI0022589176|nr:MULTISPECIES: alpha/beta hydrolase [unclassified Streptomyces]WSP53738.1 alpha/beta hydrolase [Streptomyces sp. NBC_01241]WSU25593.1 alpha/beta hydrolase [Streptomyces sp. NBC_01108]MCX4785139.1 alpha/beta hydrolase [Streptomyces sp. NBC_01221]MCX4798920.1 alpha/beta hydrolase [Streptomyces sp. NBC_01242]WSJ40118.1 alpha/beta hydrolase [Streptomyces sp. NBC_01321]